MYIAFNFSYEKKMIIKLKKVLEHPYNSGEKFLVTVSTVYLHTTESANYEHIYARTLVGLELNTTREGHALQ